MPIFSSNWMIFISFFVLLNIELPQACCLQFCFFPSNSCKSSWGLFCKLLSARKNVLNLEMPALCQGNSSPRVLSKCQSRKLHTFRDISLQWSSGGRQKHPKGNSKLWIWSSIRLNVSTEGIELVNDYNIGDNGNTSLNNLKLFSCHGNWQAVLVTSF